MGAEEGDPPDARDQVHVRGERAVRRAREQPCARDDQRDAEGREQEGCALREGAVQIEAAPQARAAGVDELPADEQQGDRRDDRVRPAEGGRRSTAVERERVEDESRAGRQRSAVRARSARCARSSGARGVRVRDRRAPRRHASTADSSRCTGGWSATTSASRPRKAKATSTGTMCGMWRTMKRPICPLPTGAPRRTASPGAGRAAPSP